jgi:hypothetical protein
MLQGKCIDANTCTNLKVGEVYYLFPHGGSAYEVSRFPYVGSHVGTYQKCRFELVETVTSLTTPLVNKYLARVVKPPSHFYQVSEEYIITEPNENGYYSVFFKHRPDAPPIGAYKNATYFEHVEPFRASEAVVVNDLPKIVKKTIETERDMPEIVNVPHKSLKYEQLTLFLE